jgi:hypothetical protein
VPALYISTLDHFRVRPSYGLDDEPDYRAQKQAYHERQNGAVALASRISGDEGGQDKPEKHPFHVN